jgi:hypothetical protein
LERVVSEIEEAAKRGSGRAQGSLGRAQGS